MAERETTELRWFDKYPSCLMCSKRADGVLYGTQNQSYGAHCQRCADKRLKASEAARKEVMTTPLNPSIRGRA